MPIGKSWPRTVVVRDVALSIFVTQTAKTVWIATGSYLGELHSEKGSSDSSAAFRWVTWASNRVKH